MLQMSRAGRSFDIFRRFLFQHVAMLGMRHLLGNRISHIHVGSCPSRRYARLDGSTNRVQRMIDIAQFQAPGSSTFIYILNTRAGGLGVNLQTADTCILFDSDWNPQVPPHPPLHTHTHAECVHASMRMQKHLHAHAGMYALRE